MAISGKPQKPITAVGPKQEPDEQIVRKLIHKGGSVAEAGRSLDPGSIKPMLVQLRLYPEMVAEIDVVRKNIGGKRHRAPSRHAWIVQAIEEKLAREKGLQGPATL
jgi:hypothetical protein